MYILRLSVASVVEVTYSRMPEGRFCDGFKNEIHSRKECSRASTLIGIPFHPEQDNDQTGFPRCSYDIDMDVVRYNKNHSRKRTFDELSSGLKKTRRAICTTGNQIKICLKLMSVELYSTKKTEKVTTYYIFIL